MNFFTAKNLKLKELTEGAPWDFFPGEEKLAIWRKMPKANRRNAMVREVTDWQVYSAVAGVNPNLRVSLDNPACAFRGIVGDYDMKIGVEGILGLLAQIKPRHVPNFIEITLSGNARLIWLLPREVLIPNPEMGRAILETFIKELEADTLLPGFDEHSIQPAEVWTNGGEWHTVKDEPLPWDLCFGILCKASKKFYGERPQDIPLQVIYDEIEKRWPGRWKGPFDINNTGVRFWDQQADCPTGCQVKGDGMLCFTGHTGFMSWEKIFGAAWVKEKQATNMGQAANGIYFDGRVYWEQTAGIWVPRCREDILLTLRNRGLSPKTSRGETTSPADRALLHIQTINRIAGAGPCVNYPPGIIDLKGQKILNTTTLRPFTPSEKEDATPIDFPWLWKFLSGLFANPDKRPLEYFLAWLQRSYNAARLYRKDFGQALFLCGPVQNGKTLLCFHVVAPLLGGKVANPYEYFTGSTSFNSQLFESFLLAINDEEATLREEAKQKFMAKIKAWVVNPGHDYHKKFSSVLNDLEWIGRILSTLNNDTASVALLPEVKEDTKDKMMFFGTKAYEGEWPDRDTIEGTIKRELPYFARWLINWKPPQDILCGGRMDVKSYYDPDLLRTNAHGSTAYALYELIAEWCASSPYWDGSKKEWIGTATKLVREFSLLETNNPLIREWTPYKVGKAMIQCSRHYEGVYIVQDPKRQRFKIIRSEVHLPEDSQ